MPEAWDAEWQMPQSRRLISQGGGSPQLEAWSLHQRNKIENKRVKSAAQGDY